MDSDWLVHPSPSKGVKSLKIHERDWDRIIKTIREQYGVQYMITWVLKREFGFTPRYSRRWPDHEVVYIDFVDEESKSFFMISFLGEIKLLN